MKLPSVLFLMPVLLASFPDKAKSGISISPSSLPDGTVGSSYSQTLDASGCFGACLWSNSGSLPPGLSLAAATGTISGTPQSAGAFQFSVTATDLGLASASQSYTLTIMDSEHGVSITTSSPLPDGKVGSSYSQTFHASGGATPYTWSISNGDPPSGLSLGSSSGALTGTPSAAGDFSFTVQVKEKNGGSTTKNFRVTIAASSSKLAITTSSLPNGTAGSAYSQTLTASGGSPSYSWSVTSGALPGGLSLNSSSGTISGTPASSGTFPFTVRVTDKSSATADQSLQITIASASTPTLSLSGVSDTAGSAIQMPLGLVLSAPASQQVTGQMTLSFQPDAAVSRDDPGIQFSSGSRTVSFSIPAKSTNAVFSSGPLALQTGTVAGTLTLSVSSNVSGGNFTRTIVVARSGPILQSATVVQNSSGFQVQVSGFSNTRELTGASFHFTAASGQTLQTSELSVSLSSPASQWYSSSTSTQFGGQFLLVVPFTVAQGAASGISSIGVQLQNGEGPSATATARF